jgi:two-component system, chemotaxis family, protein-glutamate methylesterase/glutaminase
MPRPHASTENDVIRVLIVDDSAVLRQSIRLILQSDPELLVVGEANNGLDAIAMAEKLQPDVITMDIQMPKMDGLGAIREIMAEHPAPIVVVTGADLDRDITLASQATKVGAISVLKRPEGIGHAGYQAFAVKLIEQVKLMSAVKVIRRPKELTGHPPPVVMAPAAHLPELVAIGSSTGGPAALHRILSALPADFPVPILIVQHISFGFVEGLASWLGAACPLKVKVGSQGERIETGTVYIAPDGSHMQVDRFHKIVLSNADPVSGFRPSVTAMFESVAYCYGAGTVAVILTGMGSDGAVGMKALHAAGATTLAQDEASCVVYGMPKEAIALGVIDRVVALDQVARVMTELCTQELKP